MDGHITSITSFSTYMLNVPTRHLWQTDVSLTSSLPGTFLRWCGSVTERHERKVTLLLHLATQYFSGLLCICYSCTHHSAYPLHLCWDNKSKGDCKNTLQNVHEFHTSQIHTRLFTTVEKYVAIMNTSGPYCNVVFFFFFNLLYH